MLHSFRFAKLTKFFLVCQTRHMEYLWVATPVDHDMLAQLAQYVPQYSNNNNMPQFSNDAYGKSWLTTLAPLPSPSLPLQLPPSCPTHTHSHTQSSRSGCEKCQSWKAASATAKRHKTVRKTRLYKASEFKPNCFAICWRTKTSWLVLILFCGCCLEKLRDSFSSLASEPNILGQR